MNERIQELAEQANAWYPRGYPCGELAEAAWQNLVIFEKEDLEKFAELIVKETMQVVANNLPQNTYLDVADAVIEHFGVE